MCPISGMVQFLIIVVTLLLLCHTVVVRSLRITFEPKTLSTTMHHSHFVNYTIEPTGLQDDLDGLELYVENTKIASLPDGVLINAPFPTSNSFKLTGNFLGKTKVLCRSIKEPKTDVEGSLDVTVTREVRAMDTAFTASVATLVSIIYINFGCALNWKEMIANLKRPVGPAIGFVGQFLVMPLLSFGLGQVLFPENHEMQLGMFFTGISPAGGASNIWTVVLEGNMDLSVTMTTISTLAAFGMIPLWVFTLGKVIFDRGDITVPYQHISTLALGLIVPLAIGFLISRYLKKVANFLVRILKGFSAILLLFIIVFAIVTNLYLFELFSWRIVIAGMGLPYLGYILGYILAKVLRQPPPDCLAIAIETGIQNTGIAIFLLRFALPQPEADLTTVAPVSVAMMTPFPLLLMYIYKKIAQRISASRGQPQKLRKISENNKEFAVLNDGDNNNFDEQIAVIS